MRFPSFFGTLAKFNSYMECINAIEIGDQVECYIYKDYFEGIDSVCEASNTITLPIIGKRKTISSFCGRAYKCSAVGISEENAKIVLCGYPIDELLLLDYNINLGNEDLLVYTNNCLDIVYKRIIKRK